MQRYFDENGLPTEVDLYSTSILVEPSRVNYPPGAWFEREGWTPPVIVDDRTDSIHSALGMPNVPAWVVVGSDNVVVQRVASGITVEQFEELVALAAGA
ncbi:MAG TPA: hypothetical protein VLT15_05455 [Acidimicrobiia bacterium]|nr:hypothetical protein [Acidimicrobiia bacterium]